MVYKAGDYGPANSIQNQDLGARVWLKLSNFYFWTFQDQEARHRWVTAVLRTALLIKTKLLRSVSLLTAQCIFFITVLPISQRNCVSVPTAVFEGFGCISSPPKGRPHAEQKSPKGAGSPPPPSSCAALLKKQPFSSRRTGQAAWLCRAVVLSGLWQCRSEQKTRACSHSLVSFVCLFVIHPDHWI